MIFYKSTWNSVQRFPALLLHVALEISQGLWSLLAPTKSLLPSKTPLSTL